MNNLIILSFIFGLPYIGNCGEFASWWQKTRNNNEIRYEKFKDKYLIGISCKDSNVEANEMGHIVSNLTKWYFYKNQIIGEFKKEDNTAFFIFDELSCRMQTFDSKPEFENALKESNLNPIIWTRWYKSHWGMIFSDGDFAEGIIFIFIKLPILIITTIVILVRLVKTKFNFHNKLNKIALVIIAIIVGRILLDIFPNSI